MMDQAASQQNVQNSKALAIVSLVLGILAVLTGFVFIGALLGIAAIIFGSVSLAKKRAGKGLAIAGIITGGVGIVATIISIIFISIAIPQTQRNQQDVVTRSQVSNLVKDISVYKTENRGNLPSDDELQRIAADSELDVAVGSKAEPGKVVFTRGVYCQGQTGEGRFSVQVVLKSDQIYCQGE